MKKVEEVQVVVNNDVELFPIATSKGWNKSVGHRVTIKGLEFAVIPKEKGFGITDISSGLGFFNIKHDKYTASRTVTKEDSVKFFGTEVAGMILDQLDKVGNQKYIEAMASKKREFIDMWGPQPEVMKLKMEVH